MILFTANYFKELCPCKINFDDPRNDGPESEKENQRLHWIYLRCAGLIPWYRGSCCVRRGSIIKKIDQSPILCRSQWKSASTTEGQWWPSLMIYRLMLSDGTFRPTWSRPWNVGGWWHSEPDSSNKATRSFARAGNRSNKMHMQQVKAVVQLSISCIRALAGLPRRMRMVESEPIESWSVSLSWWAMPIRFSGNSFDKSENSPLWIVVTNEAGTSGVKPPLSEEKLAIAGTELIGSWRPRTSKACGLPQC